MNNYNIILTNSNTKIELSGNTINNILLVKVETTTTTTTIVPHDSTICIGNIYNIDTIMDVRNIAPVGWRVPTADDFEILLDNYIDDVDAARKLLDTDPQYWSDVSGLTNSDGLTLRGGGFVDTSETFFGGQFYVGISDVNFYMTTTEVEGELVSLFATIDFMGSGLGVIIASIPPVIGASILFIKNDSVDDGTVTDNDGYIYNTIKIGNQVWTKTAIKSTKFRNGDSISRSDNSATWMAAIGTTPLYTIYDGETNNCDGYVTTTTTTTTEAPITTTTTSVPTYTLTVNGGTIEPVPTYTLTVNGGTIEANIPTTTTTTTTSVIPDSALVMTWDIQSNNETLSLPLIDQTGLTYNFEVNWGDGTIETITGTTAEHEYLTSGVKTVIINGEMEGWGVNSEFRFIQEKLLSISGGSGHTFKNLYRGFYWTKNLIEFNCPDWDVSQITDMNSMFSRLNFNSTLTTFNFSNWDTSNLDITYSMFSYATVDFDISDFYTSNVTNMGGMFSGAKINTDLSTINVSGAINLTNMFSNSTATDTPINISGWDISNVETTYAMFNSSEISNLDISSWNMTNVSDLRYMFSNCDLPAQNLSGWNVSNATSFISMFENSDMGATNLSGWTASGTTRFMFKDATTNPNTSNWNVSGVTDMHQMFMNNTNADPDTSSWDVSNVYDMFYMFAGATSANPNVSGWDVTSVTIMYSMFDGATSANPNVSNWDLSNGPNMDRAFAYSNINVDTSSWNTSAVTFMERTFYNCTNMTTSVEPFIFWLNDGTGTTVTSHSYCFTGAVNISNYNDIPLDWGGGLAPTTTTTLAPTTTTTLAPTTTTTTLAPTTTTTTLAPTTTTTTLAPTTTTTTLAPTTTTTTTTVEPYLFESEYGLLYNYHAAIDVKNLANDGWRVPYSTDYVELEVFAGCTPDNLYYVVTPNTGGRALKETGTTYWDDDNGLDTLGFKFRGGGVRGNTGGLFDAINIVGRTWCRKDDTPLTTGIRIGVVNGDNEINNTNFGGGALSSGFNIRLVRETSDDPGFYIGNDGKKYKTIKIGNQVWTENIAETKYRNYDNIPEVTGNTTWAELTIGAMCAYDNDWNNVGYSYTTTTTTLTPTTTTTTLTPTTTTTTTL